MHGQTINIALSEYSSERETVSHLWGYLITWISNLKKEKQTEMHSVLMFTFNMDGLKQNLEVDLDWFVVPYAGSLISCFEPFFFFSCFSSPYQSW